MSGGTSTLAILNNELWISLEFTKPFKYSTIFARCSRSYRPLVIRNHLFSFPYLPTLLLSGSSVKYKRPTYPILKRFQTSISSYPMHRPPTSTRISVRRNAECMPRILLKLGKFYKFSKFVANLENM